MALVSVNEKTGLSMRLDMPRVGAWHADLKVDTPDNITGAVTVVVNDGVMTLKGTVVRGGAYADAVEIRVVGGAGGLQRLAKPKHYNTPRVRAILGHILGDAGETLSTTVASSILDRQLAAWTTAALPGGALLSRLCATIGGGVVWRILTDGTVWLGVETWPDSGLREIDDYQVILEMPADGAAVLGVEAPSILPGTVVEGRRVSRVDHVVGETVRSRVLFEDDGATTDRTLDAWAGALGGSVVDTFYRGSYIGTLIQQEDDTVDVRFADTRLPSMAKVPIFGGVPGMRTNDARGGRVVVSWGGADPAQPKGEAFDSSVTGGTTTINADTALNLGGADGVEPTLKATTYRSAEDVYLTAIVTGVQAALSALTLPAAAAALTAAQQAFNAAAAGFPSVIAKVK